MMLSFLIKLSLILVVSSLVILLPVKQDLGAHPTSITPIVTPKAKPISKLPEPSVAPKALLASKTVVKPPEAPGNTSQASSAGIPGNAAKAFIYEHESGNRPEAVNPGGCRGLGQACPGSKLPCDVDYACQDAWFEGYMQRTYGSWEAAKAHWLARIPINGKDVGNWW